MDKNISWTGSWKTIGFLVAFVMVYYTVLYVLVVS